MIGLRTMSLLLIVGISLSCGRSPKRQQNTNNSNDSQTQFFPPEEDTNSDDEGDIYVPKGTNSGGSDFDGDDDDDDGGSDSGSGADPLPPAPPLFPLPPPSYFPPLWSNVYSDTNGWSVSSHYETIRFPDLNGDGRQDVCGRGGDGIYCTLSGGQGFGAVSRWSTGYGNNTGWGNKIYWGTIQYTDLNNDGFDDVCGRASGGIYCALSNGTKFDAPYHWTKGYGDGGGWAKHEYYWGTIRLPDINGDGRADVCARASRGIYCSVSDGSSFINIRYWTNLYNNKHGWATERFYWGTINFPDLNGDGKADVCGRASAGMYCGLSNGSSFHSVGS